MLKQRSFFAVLYHCHVFHFLPARITTNQAVFKQPTSKATLAPFDIIHTKITTEGNVATFHMAVSGKAGLSKPTPTGQLAGSDVFSYVWPTSIDSYEVGFEKKGRHSGTGSNITS